MYGGKSGSAAVFPLRGQLGKFGLGSLLRMTRIAYALGLGWLKPQPLTCETRTPLTTSHLIIHKSSSQFTGFIFFGLVFGQPSLVKIKGTALSNRLID